MPEVGGKGQKKIAKAKILLVGAGGLGSPAALYLAAAGIGTIGLIDSDVVDLSNLHRQILHHTSDVGRPKVVSGKEKIQALNPDVQVSTYEERLTAGNALKIISDYDVVIDGVDNFTAKFLDQRRLFLCRKTIGPWRHPPLRWTCDDHCAEAVRLLSLCLQNSAACRAGSLLPGGGRDRRVSRHHWHDPSH